MVGMALGEERRLWIPAVENAKGLLAKAGGALVIEIEVVRELR
jgi:hypothetical protein